MIHAKNKVFGNHFDSGSTFCTLRNKYRPPPALPLCGLRATRHSLFTQHSRQDGSTMKASVLISFIMLSSFARSFSTQSSRLIARQYAGAATSRWMTTPAGADTSIVETCRSKIAAALETEDVKVTGEFLYNGLVSRHESTWFSTWSCRWRVVRSALVCLLHPWTSTVLHLSSKPQAASDSDLFLSAYYWTWIPYTLNAIRWIGAYDDPNGSHIAIEVTSEKFEGKRPVQRQQLVYKALWEELQGPVHAVDSMICKTPGEKWVCWISMDE